MKMKKYLLGLAVLVSGMAVITSCSDSNSNSNDIIDNGGNNGGDNGDNKGETKKDSVTKEVAFFDAAYVVNSGNMYSNIESSLTYINANTNAETQGAFKAANERSLGNTANDGIVYGDKIYLVVDQSNTIEVLDRKTLKSIKQIKTTELMGTTEGNEPRHIISGSGHVFFTTYGGYVGVVDTLDYKLQAKYQVGKYPEGLVGYGTDIYVANSNYGQGGGNLSVIRLGNGTVDTYDIEGVNNPTKVFYVNDKLYVLDGQYYDAAYNTYGENAVKLVDLGSKTSTKVIEGNYACLYSVDNSSKFYVINAPYGGTPAYNVYDLTTGSSSALALSEELDSPCGIGVEPTTGNIFILSYQMGDAGYADYSGNGYMIQFDNTGKKLYEYNTGVGACAVFFDSGYKTVKVPK